MLLKKISFALSIAGLCFVTACSKGGDGGTSAGGGGGDGGGTTQNDKARWPETGDYNTSLTINGCTDTYSFGNKADYCVALTDEQQSKCNTYEMRKATYEGTCGNDFAPRNLRAVVISGYDSYLGRKCEVNSHTAFPRVADLCHFLADEDKNQGCFWEDRKEAFENYKCSGDFSARPAQPAPAPQPTPGPSPNPPTPAPGPAPQPAPASAFDQLVKDFAAFGVELKFDRPSIQLPGQKPFDQMLKDFVPVLAQFKPEFQARAKWISTVQLTDYTAFHHQYGHLTLGVDLNSTELNQYIALLDMRNDLLMSSGVTLDLGVEMDGMSPHKLSYVSDAVSFFGSQKAALKMISPIVKKMTVGSLNTIGFFDFTYVADLKDYKNQILSDLDAMKELALLAAQGVKYSGYLDLVDSRTALADFGDFARKNGAGIGTLKALMGGLEFNLDATTDSAPYLIQGLKKITIPMKTRFSGGDGLKALISAVPALTDVGAEWDVDHYELIPELAVAVRHLNDRRIQIVAHKKSIRRITFTAGASDFYNETLLLSWSDSISDLDRVLSKIP